MGTSKKGDMELLFDIARPQIGLITNVGKDHLEFLDSPEGVLAVIRQLLDGLPPEGVAIFYQSDVRHRGIWVDKGCRGEFHVQ